MNETEKKVSSSSFSRTRPQDTITIAPGSAFIAGKDNVKANIKVDADGHVSFDIGQFTNCSTLVIVIEDKKNSVCETINIGSNSPALNDIRLDKSRDPNKVYLHERVSHKLLEGQQLAIPDLRTTDMKIISSLEQFVDIMKLMTHDCKLDDWNFIKNWESLSSEDKLKNYDKFASHELNIFAYFKDREFFDLVIKQHLLNKNEKVLIDYFLLDDKKELTKYLEPVQAEKINLFEQCLVVMALKDTNKEECERLLGFNKLYLEAINKIIDNSS